MWGLGVVSFFSSYRQGKRCRPAPQHIHISNKDAPQRLVLIDAAHAALHVHVRHAVRALGPHLEGVEHLCFRGGVKKKGAFFVSQCVCVTAGVIVC